MIRKVLLVAIVAALTATSLNTAPAAAVALVCPPGTMPFDDVADDSFAFDDVTCIFELGVTKGTSKTTYSPKDFVTREQMASFIARLYEVLNGSPAPIAATPFTDMPQNFATDDIGRIYGLGVTTGTSFDKYSPNDFVTREQMASFLARLRRSLEGFCASPEIPFTDVPDTSFARLDVACIFGLAVTTGTTKTTYSPSDFVTREQMASFLARLYRAGSRDVVHTPDTPDTSACDLRTALLDVDEVVTSDHIAVWWGPGSGDLSSVASLVLTDMEAAWAKAIGTLGLSSPPGTPQYCTNIYLAGTGGSTDALNRGFGTDVNGVPFVNLPIDDADDFLITPPGPNSYSAFTAHEIMHVFQVGSPFPSTGDHAWYLEATSEWFVDILYPTDTDGLDTVAAYLLNPQLPLWATRYNQGVDQATLSWSRRFHDFGAQAFLIWLSDNAAATPTIADAFRLAPDGALPQEWLFDNLAPSVDMAAEYAEFAAHAATVDFSRNAAAIETHVADWEVAALNDGDVNTQTAVWGDTGTDGVDPPMTWRRPPAALRPAAWAYNAIRVDVTTNGTFTVDFNPDATGSALTASALTASIVVNRAGVRDYTHSLVGGTAAVPVLAGDELWLVVASTPDLFSGSEVFDYQYRIYR